MRTSQRRRSTWVRVAVAMGGAFAALPAGGAHAQALPDPVPVPSLPAIEQQAEPSARLVTIPPGCPTSRQEQVVFLGTITATDSQTARFQIDQIRAGSAAGFEVTGLIDVRYGDEVRFLERGERYLVGAGRDPETGVLISSVRTPAPLFGGSDVAGLDDPEVACPVVEDPVRTLLVDTSSVESGVVTPLTEAKGKLLGAILQPAAVAFAVLVGLAALKLLVFAIGRTLRDLGPDTDEPLA